MEYEQCDIKLLLKALEGAFTMDDARFYLNKASDYLKACEKKIAELTSTNKE